jgi:hypothetical protein
VDAVEEKEGEEKGKLGQWAVPLQKVLQEQTTNVDSVKV